MAAITGARKAVSSDNAPVSGRGAEYPSSSAGSPRTAATAHALRGRKAHAGQQCCRRD